MMNRQILAWAGSAALLLATGSATVNAAETARPAAPATVAALDKLTELENAFTQVAEKAFPSVVVITSKRNAQPPPDTARMIPPEFRYFFNLPDTQGNDGEEEDAAPMPRRFGGRRNLPPPQQHRDPIQTGKGSGVIIRADGYILTNAHVIDGSDALEVRLHDGRIFDSAKDKDAVTVVGVDQDTDLAVLRLDGGKIKDLQAMSFADSAKVKVGQFAIAVGAPFSLDYSVSIGHVSQKGRYDVNINTYENYIQTDASINPGNSGGPLLNLRGEIVGINEFIITGGQFSQGSVGIGFAIASNLARQVADSMIANKGKVVRPWVGISMQPLTPELKKQFKAKEGVLVGDVIRGDPAEQAGVKPGDVVTKIGETPVRSPHNLQFALLAYNPGDPIPVTLLRNGKEMTLQLVARQKQETGNEENAGAGGGGDALESSGLALEETKEGVKVRNTMPDSVAARVGLRSGDLILEVNRQPVKTVGDAARALKSTGGDTAVLYISRRDMRAYVALPVGGEKGP